MKQIKIGIVGSRRRNSDEDYNKLIYTFDRIVGEFLSIYFGQLEVTIVTGDCDEGGDKFAREMADEYKCILDEKKIKHPQTGEEMDFKNHKRFPYLTMCGIFYSRNEEIAKEPLDYLIALVAPDRKGGTENTIRHFRRLHKDWKDKLVII